MRSSIHVRAVHRHSFGRRADRVARSPARPRPSRPRSARRARRRHPTALRPHGRPQQDFAGRHAGRDKRRHAPQRGLLVGEFLACRFGRREAVGPHVNTSAGVSAASRAAARRDHARTRGGSCTVKTSISVSPRFRSECFLPASTFAICARRVIVDPATIMNIVDVFHRGILTLMPWSRAARRMADRHGSAAGCDRWPGEEVSALNRAFTNAIHCQLIATRWSSTQRVACSGLTSGIRTTSDSTRVMPAETALTRTPRGPYSAAQVCFQRHERSLGRARSKCCGPRCRSYLIRRGVPIGVSA